MAALVRSLRLSQVRQISALIRPLSSSSRLGTSEQGKVTHTGQQFSEDDYRNVRFVDKEKMVNPQFAIDLIASDPIVVSTERVVSSHSGGALGHPKVYINLDPPEVHSCGYSGRKFILKKYYNAAEHGPSITYEEYLSQE